VGSSGLDEQHVVFPGRFRIDRHETRFGSYRPVDLAAQQSLFAMATHGGTRGATAIGRLDTLVKDTDKTQLEASTGFQTEQVARRSDPGLRARSSVDVTPARGSGTGNAPHGPRTL